MYLLYKLIERLCGFLPESAVPVLGRFLGWIYGSVVRYNRADAFEALARAFPDRSPEALRGMVKAMYRNLGTNVVEALRLPRMPKEWFERMVDFEGLERLDAVLAEGRGAVILCAHLGNWEMMAAIAPLYDISMNIVAKTLNPPGLQKAVVRSRERFGMNVIDRRNALRPSLAALKANQVLGFMLDQNMIRKEGVYVDFFGRLACTTPGLAQIAAMSGAPVLPGEVYRTPEGTHRVVIHEPLPPPQDREDETVRAFTQHCSHVLEGFIRKHPEQWIWLHRRWRTKPLPGVPDFLGWDGVTPLAESRQGGNSKFEIRSSKQILNSKSEA